MFSATPTAVMSSVITQANVLVDTYTLVSIFGLERVAYNRFVVTLGDSEEGLAFSVYNVVVLAGDER